MPFPSIWGQFSRGAFIRQGAFNTNLQCWGGGRLFYQRRLFESGRLLDRLR